MAILMVGAGPRDLILNGNFETGDLSGWTVLNQVGGAGNWQIQQGRTSPISGTTVPAPPGGRYAAMSDQPGGGAGSHVIYQDIVLPVSIGSVVFDFSLLLNSPGGILVPDAPSLGFRGDPTSTPGLTSFDPTPTRSASRTMTCWCRSICL